MKIKIIFILLTLKSFEGHAQNKVHKNNQDESYGLYISGGTHFGLWALAGQEKIPYNFQIDKLFKNDIAIGAGYTFDTYISCIFSSSPINRQNLRVRIYHYKSDPSENFSTYWGAAAGISTWKNEERNISLPSAQFFFGLKIEISDMFYSQTEIAIGPPSLVQSSIGIKF